MIIPYYQTSVFTGPKAKGNQAMVAILPKIFSKNIMQNLARKNQTTIAFVHQSSGWHINWFSPQVEIELCGHGSLAAGAILITPPKTEICLQSNLYHLQVERTQTQYVINLPIIPYKTLEKNNKFSRLYGNKTHILILDSPEKVFSYEHTQNSYLLVSSAGHGEIDFVYRYFTSPAGIYEDQGTGSARSVLSPYWAQRLNKKTLTARQLSPRGAYFQSEILSNKVKLYANLEISKSKKTLII